MKIIVFGAGAWGTAMALSAAAHPAGHGVTLWARDAGQAAAMQAARQNARYLPGIAFPAVLGLASGAPFEALASCQADLAIVATPMSGLRGMLEELRAASVPVAWLCKGFEAVPASGEAAAQGLMAHEICSQVAPQLRAGALSGPSFALEAAQGRPTALVAASRDARVRELLVEAFHGPTLRVYANEDIVGVEVGGGCEECAGHCHRAVRRAGPGHERARALITRGLAEMSRLGLALGARAETFMGLSGLGDLVLTATGDLSRNRRVGLALARGLTLDQAVESLGTWPRGCTAHGPSCAVRASSA
ncbi:NAD(P)H-dependent glycerol-3-phosphate dehydrogenase, partial [Paracidovorax cattleyae]|uniref:NAD(P)H-dependent glycerol-3-phosphate dehydrogenase n=1 Tax=Paracidovorax cattleyae TaxID=80868 RepID=UPI001E594631